MSRAWTWLPLAYLGVFFLVPTGVVISYSCFQRDFSGQVHTVLSSDGWRQATDSRTLGILAWSLGLAAGVTAACLGLGYPYGLALARMDRRRRRVGVVLISFPLVISMLLRIYGWLNLLPLAWRGGPWAIGLVMTANYLPFMVLPLLRAHERADPNLPLAAMDLGATPWWTFWYVTWPLTRPGIWAGCTLVFIPALGEYLVPHFIGEGKVMVLGTLIVQEFMERRNWPYAAASAVWLLAIVALPTAAAALGFGPGERTRGAPND